jgi:hypothetical protein
MVAADFLDLQEKSYVMLNPDEEDWRKLKLQSISIKQHQGDQRKCEAGFFRRRVWRRTSGNPGEIRNHRGGDCRIDIKGQFHRGTHCTVAPSLWSD